MSDNIKIVNDDNQEPIIGWSQYQMTGKQSPVPIPEIGGNKQLELPDRKIRSRKGSQPNILS